MSMTMRRTLLRSTIVAAATTLAAAINTLPA
ncbi:putative small secreted protein, partial [Mesorhizobium sangaii]|nr:putative small secreted protein [Mesorhizobium sangaii]